MSKEHVGEKAAEQKPKEKKERTGKLKETTWFKKNNLVQTYH